MQATPGSFESHRPALLRLAYRMLGSVSEAEDAVQDAFVRWHAAEGKEIDNPQAYLSATVTRLCLDRLKEARRRREVYVGQWLPEPLVETQAEYWESPDETTAGDVSFALMMALERLSPLERAAFLLHDVFDADFAEVAKALGRSEAACRQLAARARRHVRSERPRFALRPGEGEEVARLFFDALRSGNVAALGSLLAEEAVLHSDGGGQRPAALRPIVGAAKIERFLAGIARKGSLLTGRWSMPLRVNATPGLLAVGSDGTLQTFALEIADGRVRAIYLTRNPEKLGHLVDLVPEELRQAG